MNKREDGTFDFAANPAVREELERGHRLKAQQRLSPEKRSRAARQKEIDARRNRRNIDMPADLERAVEELAADLSIPFSQLASYLMAKALETIDRDALNAECKPSRSMRFERTLPYPGNLKNKHSKGSIK